MFTYEQTTFRRMFAPACALAAALTALSLFDTGIAQASCGDYVMVGAHGQSHHADRSLPGVPTCHGPHCQRHAPLPLGPTKGAVDAPSFDAAFWQSIARSARYSLSGLFFEDVISLPDGHAWPLLRPPSL